MTDITKRLAETWILTMISGVADDNNMSYTIPGTEKEAYLEGMRRLFEDHFSSAPEYMGYRVDRTAAQKANVQGGDDPVGYVGLTKNAGAVFARVGDPQLVEYAPWIPVYTRAAPHPTPAPDILTQLAEDVVMDGIPMKKGDTVLLKNISTPVPADDFYSPSALKEIQADLAKTPAPDSGEVFNILLGMRARLSNYRDDGSVTREAGFWLMQEIGTALTIEAATRARQGESGTVAAQGEAYRAVMLVDAAKVRDFYVGSTSASKAGMLEALQSIGAVILTAAPVPAEPCGCGTPALIHVRGEKGCKHAVPADEGEKK